MLPPRSTLTYTLFPYTTLFRSLPRDHRCAPGPARVLPGGDCLQQRMDRCRAARGARQAADQERLRAIPARPGRPRIRAMKVIETALPGCLVIEPQVFGDARGTFCESSNNDRLAAHALDRNSPRMK